MVACPQMNVNPQQVLSPDALYWKNRALEAERERDDWKNKYYREQDERFKERAIRRAPVLQPVAKEILAEFRHVERWGTVKAPDGSSRANFTTIAKHLKISPDTVARQSERMAKLGIIEIHEHQGPLDERDRKYVHVIEEKLTAIDQLTDPDHVVPKQGGNRYICPHCDSPNVEIKKVTTLHCLACNHEETIEDTGWVMQNGQKMQKQHAFKKSKHTQALPLPEESLIEEPQKQLQLAEHSVYTRGVDVPSVLPQRQVAFGDSAHIPPELKSRRIWAPWRYGPPDEQDKRGKVPFIADMSGKNKASTTKSSTWRTDEYAVACYTRSQAWEGSFKDDKGIEFSDKLDGIGFMCDGSCVGIDLDHCRNKETGEITAWAQAIIDRFASYTYITPSEEGVRIIIHANKPGPNCKKGDIELYQEKRFFTWTPLQLLGTPSEITDRQTELEAFYAEVWPPALKTPEEDRPPTVFTASSQRSDERVLEKARTARNGEKFRLLFDEGKWWELKNERDEQYYPSQSEADEGLCGMLAFWNNGNPDYWERFHQIDRLFRQSKLYRSERWDEPARAGEMYGEGTIKRALGEQWEAVA